jgi:hypothetical protein
VGGELRHIALAVLGVGLCACAGQPDRARQEAALIAAGDAAKRSCDERFPVGPRHNHVARAKCMNDLIQTTMMPGQRDPDLQANLNATRLVVAERLDAGTMTEAEGDSAMAEARVRMFSEQSQRDNGAAQARAMQSQARSAATSEPTVVVVPPATSCAILVGGRCR